MQLAEPGTMSLEETFGNLASFLNSLDAEGEQKFELSHSLVIICPDCGKGIAFRGRCPKCSGNSWIPAGHAGGIFEQMKAQHIKAIIVEPFHDRRIAEKVASATGAKVVEFSQFPGGVPGTDSYVKLIDTLVSRLAAALK